MGGIQTGKETERHGGGGEKGKPGGSTDRLSQGPSPLVVPGLPSPLREADPACIPERIYGAGHRRGLIKSRGKGGQQWGAR